MHMRKRFRESYLKWTIRRRNYWDTFELYFGQFKIFSLYTHTTAWFIKERITKQAHNFNTPPGPHPPTHHKHTHTTHTHTHTCRCAHTRTITLWAHLGRPLIGEAPALTLLSSHDLARCPILHSSNHLLPWIESQNK